MSTEQEINEMENKLKDMSPEELKQFQSQNCIFCQIINGKVASKKVYEDDKCLGILDINPCNPGHVLLMPKEHYAIMPMIPEDILKHLFMISKQLSASLLRALKAEGTNIVVANGAAAGQKAQHFMIHIIPRMEKDGIEFSSNGKKEDENVLDELSKALSSKLGKAMGEVVDKEAPAEKSKEEKIKGADAVVEADFEESSDRGVGEEGSEDGAEENPEDNDKKSSEENAGEEESAEDNKETIDGTISDEGVGEGEDGDEDIEDDSEDDERKKDEEMNNEVNLDDIANLVTGGK